MGLPIYQVDAFASEPFAGNPAAVCFPDASCDPRWMQNVAREMNLSETAFLRQENDGYRLRWFTPTVEVALCGHATLASAHILWETARLDYGTEARFHTLSGVLTATRHDEEIELNFPAKSVEPAPAPDGLAEALGVKPLFVGRSAFDYLVLVDSEETLRSVQPDFPALARLPVRGIIVTSQSSSREFDFVSRFFAPASGVNEDPVTGSAHCSLGPFWQDRLKRSQFIACQASARGGIVKVQVRDDRVCLAGRAITVLRGELL